MGLVTEVMQEAHPEEGQLGGDIYNMYNESEKIDW